VTALSFTEVHRLVAQAVRNRRANASGWIRTNCPVCSSIKGTQDTRQSFAYNTRTCGFVCNRCGTKGKVGGKVAATLPTAPVALSEKEPVAFSSPGPLPGMFPVWEHREASVLHRSVLAPAYAELERRRITLETARAYRIHAAVSGRYYHRLIIPHRDANGRWWGFTARWWEKAPPAGVVKVLYPPGMDRSRLFNEQALAVETTVPILGVEGVIDSMRYYPHVFAALGKPSEDQMQRVVDTAKRPVVLALDGDAWRDVQAWVWRARLRGFVLRGVLLPAGQDPDDIDPKLLWDAALRVCSPQSTQNLIDLA
jgi:hypothetical protein